MELVGNGLQLTLWIEWPKRVVIASRKGAVVPSIYMSRPSRLGAAAWESEVAQARRQVALPCTLPGGILVRSCFAVGFADEVRQAGPQPG